MAQIEKLTAQEMEEKNVEDMIDQLLNDEGFYDDDINPYDLESDVVPTDLLPMSIEETKFKDGIKKLPKAYKKLKSASRGSMIYEVELGTKVDGRFKRSGLLEADLKYVTAEIPKHLSNTNQSTFLIDAKKLQKVVEDKYRSKTIKPHREGNKLVALVEYDIQWLLDNSKKNVQ